MSKALHEAGYSFMTASNVRDALFKLKNQKVSCIILDPLMGEGEERGESLINHIQGRKEIPNGDTPILIIGTNLNKEILQSLAGKIRGALVKPFDMQTFITQVKKVVE